MRFTPATKTLGRLRLALCGPAGSGKTLSALRLAKGIGGTVAVIDTERGSACLYADRFQFDVLELNPPHHPTRYVEAVRAASGYGVLVVDSLSHAWAGEGGLLEAVDAAQARGGNKFSAWGPATKQQNELVNALLSYPGHLIVTMRSKQEYAVEADQRGRQQVRKLGMAPVQRDGVEYEFGTVLEIGMDHRAGVGMAGKDRTELFAGVEPHVLTEQDGGRVRDWLASSPVRHDEMDLRPEANSLTPEQQEDARRANPQPPRKVYCSQQQQDALRDIADDIGLDNDARLQILRDHGVKRINMLTPDQCEAMVLRFCRRRVGELLTELGWNLDDVRERSESVTADTADELDQEQANAALAVLRHAKERTQVPA